MSCSVSAPGKQKPQKVASSSSTNLTNHVFKVNNTSGSSRSENRRNFLGFSNPQIIFKNIFFFFFISFLCFFSRDGSVDWARRCCRPHPSPSVIHLRPSKKTKKKNPSIFPGCYIVSTNAFSLKRRLYGTAMLFCDAFGRVRNGLFPPFWVKVRNVMIRVTKIGQHHRHRHSRFYFIYFYFSYFAFPFLVNPHKTQVLKSPSRCVESGSRKSLVD